MPVGKFTRRIGSVCFGICGVSCVRAIKRFALILQLVDLLLSLLLLLLSRQYTGTGYVSPSSNQSSSYHGRPVARPPGNQRPMSGEENSWNNQYGASYGYGSPGTVPRGRGLRQSPAVVGGGGATSAGRFCYECGAKFPLSTARFCCECGARKA